MSQVESELVKIARERLGPRVALDVVKRWDDDTIRLLARLGEVRVDGVITSQMLEQALTSPGGFLRLVEDMVAEMRQRFFARGLRPADLDEEVDPYEATTGTDGEVTRSKTAVGRMRQRNAFEPVSMVTAFARAAGEQAALSMEQRVASMLENATDAELEALTSGDLPGMEPEAPEEPGEPDAEDLAAAVRRHF